MQIPQSAGRGTMRGRLSLGDIADATNQASAPATSGNARSTMDALSNVIRHDTKRQVPHGREDKPQGNQRHQTSTTDEKHIRDHGMIFGVIVLLGKGTGVLPGGTLRW